MHFSPDCYEQEIEQIGQVPGLVRELMKLVEPIPMLPELDPSLVRQVAHFNAALYSLYRGNQRWKRVPEAEEIRRLAMILFKVVQFIYSREQRVVDLHSPEMKAIVALKERLFPMGIPFLWLCIDGRCLSKLFAGLHGKAIHTPAAQNPSEFLALSDGSGFLLKEGEFTDMLRHALSQRPRLAEFLDCHIGCAAQALHERECNGVESPDAGLREDIMTKMAMARAIRTYVSAKYGDPNKIATFITSFDVNTGFMFVGLDEVVEDERVAEHGFTKQILEELVAEGRVISTASLVLDPAIREAFEQRYFDVNYAADYLSSTAKFWQAMEEIAPELLPKFEHHVRRVHPHLAHGDRADDLRQLAMVLLANCFNGYLHSFDPDGSARPYPYAEHEESVISVTVSPQGPFDRAVAFSVYPKDPQISDYLHLALGIIMGNRRAGRMSHFEKEALKQVYSNGDRAAFNYPVPAFFFERLLAMPAEDELRQIREVDWSRILDWPWRTMSSPEFIHVIDRELLPGISATAAMAIDALRLRLAEQYTPGLSAADDLIDGRIIPVPILTGPNREVIAILPFLATGFAD